jgi:hypothetical protein
MRPFRLLAIALSLGAVCLAQESRGAILGRVHDSSGAVVVGARVQAVNVATNAGASSVSNSEGNYDLNPA